MARTGGSARGASGRAPRPRRDRTFSRPASPRSVLLCGPAAATLHRLRRQRRRRRGSAARRLLCSCVPHSPPRARSSTCGRPCRHEVAAGRLERRDAVVHEHRVRQLVAALIASAGVDSQSQVAHVCWSRNWSAAPMGDGTAGTVAGRARHRPRRRVDEARRLRRARRREGREAVREGHCGAIAASLA